MTKKFTGKRSEPWEPKVLAEKVYQAKLRNNDKEALAIREKELIKKYPHVKPGSLSYNKHTLHFEVRIDCAKCQKPRTVHTSDLFQVKLCKPCVKAGV